MLRRHVIVACSLALLVLLAAAARPSLDPLYAPRKSGETSDLLPELPPTPEGNPVEMLTPAEVDEYRERVRQHFLHSLDVYVVYQALVWCLCSRTPGTCSGVGETLLCCCALQ